MATASVPDDPRLLVGPLLRYVDDTRATIWVETDRACEVVVTAAGGRHAAPTFSVHGHHYALVRIEGLPPSTATEYMVTLDAVQVWPLAGSPFGASYIRTPDPQAPVRIAFGSCRRSAPFDAEHLDALGADALVALADRMAHQPRDEWPDVLLLLGDQVYADDPSDEIVERLRAVHGRQPPGVGGSGADDITDEIRNFEEYTWLYHEAWMTTAVRWLLSTVSTCMLLDDHDLRDDWNTSMSWRRWVTAQEWWRDRVIGAYGSYWVYQHLGNLAPEQLDDDEVYGQMLAITDDEARTRYLDDFAWRTDLDAATTRFSFYRDLGGAGRRIRLVAIDSRCSRHLDPDDRRMVDALEWAWVRDAVLEGGPYDHLLLASTLPFLMLPGVHHLEGWNEAIAQGAWGRPGRRFGEWLRQFLDLEHWAAFRESFDETTDLLADVVAGDDPPATVLLLSGDVHCSYTARAHLTGATHPNTAIHQLTMSPFRNDIERAAKLGNKVLERPRPARVMRRLARWAHVGDVAMSWEVDNGPWFDNGVMTIELAGRTGRLMIDHARLDGEDQRLDRTRDVALEAPGRTPHPSLT